MAVVVSSIIAFVTAIFRQAEVCRTEIAQANEYWRELNIELRVRLYERQLAIETQHPSDVTGIVDIFIFNDFKDISQDKHVSGRLRRNTFPELILRFNNIRDAFAIPKNTEDAIFYTMLDAGLLSPAFVPAPDPDVVMLRSTPPDKLISMLQNAVIHFRKTYDYYRTLPHGCDLVSVARREIFLRPSPLATAGVSVQPGVGSL